MRKTSLLVFALLLAACPADNDAPQSDMDVGTDARVDAAPDMLRNGHLLLLTEAEPQVTFSTQVPVRVAYVDGESTPVPDAPVVFTQVGELAGSTVLPRESTTDAEGEAETSITAGEVEAAFDIEITVDGSSVEPLTVRVTIVPPAPLPDTAYVRTLDELPAGTQIVSKGELDAMIASGDASSVSIGSIRAEREAAAEKEAEDDAVIAAWEADHPGRTLMADDVEDPGHMSLPDGNTMISRTMANGEVRQFEAMGDAWVKAEIVGTLATYPTRENQLVVYQDLFDNIPIQYRDQLGLVAPDVVAADPQRYDAAYVAGMVSAIAAQANTIAVWRPVPNTPAGYVANCDLEEAAGEGSDRSGSDYSDPACQPDPNGLWANVDFPMKWFATCVKDQGNRGSCVSFAAASTMETWIAKDEARWANLSEQALYRKMKFEWEVPRSDVADGFKLNLLFPHFGNWKLPYEAAWNYNPSPNRIRDYVYVDAAWYERSCDNYDEWCSDSSHQTPLICAESGGAVECAYGWLGFTAGTPAVGVQTSAQLWDHEDLDQSVDLIRLALWMGFPVAVGYDCGWFCGHAVHVVGYVDNDDLATMAPQVAPGAGGGYFIIKNSYSNCDGDGGYLYFDYDYARENFHTAVALHGVTTAP